MFRSAAVLAAPLALALAGCGGGPSDTQKVKTTLHDYFAAFARGDAAKACDQLGAQTQARVTKESKVASCPAALAKARARPDVQRYLKGFKGAKVLSVKIAGKQATARVQAIGTTTTVKLAEENDGWRIEDGGGG